MEKDMKRKRIWSFYWSIKVWRRIFKWKKMEWKVKEFDLDNTVKYEGEYVNGKIVIA